MLIPTPDGGTHLLQPGRPVTPEVGGTIRRAAQLALTERERTPEQIIQDGHAALERARQEGKRFCTAGPSQRPPRRRALTDPQTGAFAADRHAPGAGAVCCAAHPEL